VTMMDFFTHCWKNTNISAWLRGLFLCVFLGTGVLGYAQVATDITQLRVDRSDDELQLSALLQFELPSVVEDALLKGIPMVFVLSTDVLRERWYWYDKRLAGAERHMRLAFQPLTRRWRLNVSSGAGSVGLNLNQSFETLAQALSAVKRVAKWKIADMADLDGAGKYRIECRFRLDLNQLPRPFQLGAIGPSEWDIAATAQLQISPETLK